MRSAGKPFHAFMTLSAKKFDLRENVPYFKADAGYFEKF